MPHFAPDENPFVDEFVKLYNLPREAVLGYRETLYPEYRKKIKDTYVPPPPCTDRLRRRRQLRPETRPDALDRQLFETNSTFVDIGERMSLQEVGVCAYEQ